MAIFIRKAKHQEFIDKLEEFVEQEETIIGGRKVVIYFTGTGNSRYLAKIIASELNDKLVDATKLINEKKSPQFNSETPYVIVTPTYAWRIPRLLEKWMEKCQFNGCKKLYFIMNCGAEIGGAAKYTKRLCEKLAMEYMGTAEVVMPENYIIMFKIPSEEECNKSIAKAKEQVIYLSREIKNGNVLDEVKITLLGKLYSGIVNWGFSNFYIGSKKFYATEACISCGKCERECMLHNILIKEGKPSWGKHCTHCLACINKCPVNAIEYGRNTKGKRRYVCPEE